MAKKKTTLWYVTMRWEENHPVIYVSDYDAGLGYDNMRIRTITPRAAGRKYIRDNLARRITEGDFETDNPFSRHYMNTPLDRIKQRKHYEKAATIKVLKKEKTK